ncbi:MAG: NAD(P)/FAD-dependent oxidoreductase [Gammaproteobacteria bacterium]|nr:NAD(P)/FAD-dependent oxidoreductase [Gammaproteobacteria bacterium]
MIISSTTTLPINVDVIIIGAGAAGLMCALIASQRGRDVLIIDHANKVGKKILMSGGGRCNFTNIYCEPNNFISNNPDFCKSALSRYSPHDFIALVNKHNIPYHEKKLGQLFCDNKSKDILEMLLNECHKSKVKIRTRCEVTNINKIINGFEVKTNLGLSNCQSLVIATGGLSIPKMGATGFGYKIAQQFGLDVLPTRAALVPFTADKITLDKLSTLSGSSLLVNVSCNNMSFKENLLFTHRGLSGPAILQISSYWKDGDQIEINLLPNINLLQMLKERKCANSKSELKTILAKVISKNMAQVLLDLWFPDFGFANKAINQFKNSDLKNIAAQFHCWQFKPNGSEGYRTAEVTLGGINCNEISSKTMQSNKQKGLYFIGEVLDVTGHLGGFNFQWAWASGAAAGEHV